MQLRFVEDTRALIVAFVLFPIGPLVALFLPHALPWSLPLVIYSVYVAGVLIHNQNHCPVFGGRAANAAYSMWLSVFYGVPAFAWIPTHNQNHHRFLDGPGDAARTQRAGRDGFRSLVRYSLKAGLWQLPYIVSYWARLNRKNPKQLTLPALQIVAIATSQFAFAALAVSTQGWRQGLFNYAVGFGIPVLLLGAPMMQATNYLQHVGCNPTSKNDHSRNFTSPLFNWLFFSNGFHTVHHEHPGTHWSRYRDLHWARQDKIQPALNIATPFHFALTTLAKRIRRVALT